MTSNDDRVYQLVLIWMHDRDTFTRFVSEVSPAAAKYEHAERLLVPEEVYGEGMQLPDLATVVYYESRKAFDDWHADPDIQALLPLRSKSIDMLSVTGTVLSGAVTETAVERRRYLVELARYGDGGEAAYRDYEKEAETVMAPYGYHVERVIRPDGDLDGLSFRPDLVKVAYFDDAEGMQRMHDDPRHDRLEGELYNAAVAESLWLIAAPITSMFGIGT